MLTYIPVSFLFFPKKGFELWLKIGLGLGWVLELGLGSGFGFGNLIGGAAGTVDPCGRKTPVPKKTFWLISISDTISAVPMFKN